ncbi:proteoglycan 4-like isoform X2 [Scylla paramamosain]|uniref:proteoglycan 4-like isoform X2 n=1 Tax=Scylla paramamosain TaxID=85552 RepID=UPI0030829145
MNVVAVVCLAALAVPGYAQLVQYSFNFLDGPTTRMETRDASGIVRGTFNFLDSQGNLKAQHYDYTVQAGPPAVNFAEPVPAPQGAAPVQPAEAAPEHTDEASHTAPASPELTQEKSDPAPEAPEPIQDVPAVTEAPEPTTSTPVATPATPEPTTEPPTPKTTESPFDAFKIDFKRFGQRLRALARFTPTPIRAARTKRAVVVPGPFTYAAPNSLNTFSAPLVYSHPAVAYSSAFPAVAAYSGIPAAAPAAARDAALLRVVHNPAYSVSYRVD